MVNKPKYPHKLTKGDKKILDTVVFKYALKFYAMTQKYPDPKDYAKKVVLKRLQSDKDTGILYAVAYTKTSAPGHLFKPGEINERLKNDLRTTIQQDYIDSLEEEGESQPQRLLHPRDLRERVLKKLEEEGIFIHLEEEGKIRGQRRESSRSGKKSSDDNKYFRGGRLSEYGVSEHIEKVKQVMDKDEAIEYVWRGLIESGLAQKLAKYQMQTFLHAAKMNEKVLHRMMGLGAASMQAVIQEKDTENFKVMFDKLQSLSDNELEQSADSIAKNLIASPWYYQALAFITSLFKL